MAASLDDTRVDSFASGTLCDIEATVCTGFENVAKEEAEEKFNTEVGVSRGRILVKRVPIYDVKKILDLGTIDNCRILMTRETNFCFTPDLVDCMQRLREFVRQVDWEKGLAAWDRFFSFEHPIATQPEVIPETLGEVIFSVRKPKKDETKKKRKERGKNRKIQNSQSKKMEETDSNKIEVLCEHECKATHSVETNAMDMCMSTSNVDDVNIKTSTDISSNNDKTSSGLDIVESVDGAVKVWDPLKPSFRVTCLRSGEGHCFDSMTAAANFGGAVNDYFGWNVKMTGFDIEVLLIIDNDAVSVGIGLTKQSLHKRNIVSFGPTTLLPTIAYSMLRLCSIQPGDIVCDPMCGSGSIPIQASVSWPKSMHLCGEIHPKALARTLENVSQFHKDSELHIKKDIEVDIMCWDTCCLPLKNSIVDVFITDMPFGKRSGNRMNNWKLYPQVLTEMARVGKPETGRACLLTQDKKCIIKSLQTVSKYWRRYKTLGINIGGLAAGVYLLRRTAAGYDTKQPFNTERLDDKSHGEMEEPQS